MENMNVGDGTSVLWIDWVILVVIAASSYISFRRGFFKETMSLVSWGSAAVVVWLFSEPVADYLSMYFNSPTLRLIMSASGLLIVTLIAGSIVNKIVNKLVLLTDFSGNNRVLGLLFGLIRGVVIVTALIGFGSTLPISQEIWWNDSTFVPQFEQAADWSKSIVEEIIYSTTS